MNSTPPEIWENILSYLPLRDLRSCSRLNKQLCSEAIRVIDRLSKVSLESAAQLFLYMDYLHSGGRIHKEIELELTTTELANNEAKFRHVLLKIRPSVKKCVLVTLKRKDNGMFEIADPLIRVSDNLLHEMLNLCPNFSLIIDSDACPEYILQYFVNTNLNSLRSLHIIYRSVGFNQTTHDNLERILSSAVNLSHLSLFPWQPPHPIEWPLKFLAALSGARLEKISSLKMLIERATIPDILQDARLVLKEISIVAFSTAKVFNGAVERLLVHHAKSLERLNIIYPDIKYPGEIPNFQLPEMPKLKDLDLSSRREDSWEFPPYLPTLPAKFPPALKRIRILMRFHNQNFLEKQLKAVFRYHWGQVGAKFPQITSIEFAECYSIYPKCRERIGNRILGRLIKMFPNAEIRLRDEKVEQLLVITKLGTREKWEERSR